MDSRYLRSVPVFEGGMYYQPNGIPKMGLLYPTVYVRSRSEYIESLSYDVKKYRWIHIIKPLISTSKGKGIELYFIG
ncbi:MAG: hypothetical protein DRN04_12735 [Thermoprotei archaeon]|nr:MAG: hypothetical protein DRN04_12735 [Thermoprotei archaeon]